MLLILMTGCGGSGTAVSRPSPSSTAPPPSSTAPPPSSTAPPPSSTTPSATRNPPLLKVSDKDNLGTAVVPVGGRIQVTLASTAWTLSTSSNPVLEMTGIPERVKGACRPGVKCGSTTQTFIVRTAGKADITGVRGSCGEALRCTAAQGRFVLHVTALPGMTH